MSEEHRSQTDAEGRAPDLPAQMRAARQAITQSAARALAPEPRSFRPEKDDDDTAQ